MGPKVFSNSRSSEVQKEITSGIHYTSLTEGDYTFFLQLLIGRETFNLLVVQWSLNQFSNGVLRTVRECIFQPETTVNVSTGARRTTEERQVRVVSPLLRWNWSLLLYYQTEIFTVIPVTLYNLVLDTQRIWK